MDARTQKYLQERRKVAPKWTATPRLVSGVIGGGLGKLVPGHPTPTQIALYMLLGAVGGILIVEAIRFAWGFLWVAPKAMYFDALALVDAAERNGQQRVEAAQAKFDYKYKVYTDSIKGLQEDIARRQAEIDSLKAQLHKMFQDQAFADVLTERYDYGLHEIMNWHILQKRGQLLKSDEFGQWIEREREWTAGVRRLLEEHGCNQQIIAHFGNIQEVRHGSFHVLPDVNHKLSMFSERLNRLKTVSNIQLRCAAHNEYEARRDFPSEPAELCLVP